MDLHTLHTKGLIRHSTGTSKSGFHRIPDEYLPYLPPVLRLHQWDQAARDLPPFADSEGICYVVLENVDQATSKRRKEEFDGLQLLVDAIWKEGRTDLFDLPIVCCVDYLCFRVIAVPMQLWLPDEPPLKPFLSARITSNPDELAKWESVNAPVAEALRGIARRIPTCGDYPVGPEGDDKTSSLLLSVSRQRLVPCCPVGLVGPPAAPSDDLLSRVANQISNFNPLVTCPLVLRSFLRENGIRVRFIGRILLKTELPVFKKILVADMIGRAAKWHFRRLLHARFEAHHRMSSLDPVAALKGDAVETALINAASAYFQVPASEIAPYMPTTVDLYQARYSTDSFATVHNRTLFPHATLLGIESGFFPTTRIVCPSPVVVDTSAMSPIEALPLRYAANLFALELAIARGDLLHASVVIGNLADVIVRMRDIEPIPHTKEAMKAKVLALCTAGRTIVPLALSLPWLITESILHCVPSVSLYSEFRYEIVKAEGPGSIALLTLDSMAAEFLFDSNPGRAAEILTLCADKAEKCLGARHPLTIAAWIRKGQALKRVLESAHAHASREAKIQEGIRCLNKALRASEMSPPDSTRAVLDHQSFAHHLLAILYLWNGEAGKAVAVSRDGLTFLQAAYGLVHPRYLNSAFLHAKLLEGYAASVRDSVVAVATAREAVEVLEALLNSLLDLSADSGDVPGQADEFRTLFGPDVLDVELDLKRKLAVTALLLKLNVWLLDASVASDLLDLVVSADLSGSRGVLELPHRTAVKEAVVDSLRARMENHLKETSALPVLELSASLPETVRTACNMALAAKSKGQRVSHWFDGFRETTMRLIGGATPESAQNKEVLVSLFVTFVYIVTPETVYAGPLSLPLVPREAAPQLNSSGGVIYTDWERSATLYSLDHGVRPRE